ncbi:RNA methyltransferase [Gilvimarinus sp. DA14]|uniref:TrmH family RNA methyltransferase n=1 Tax=Gilvimarinus sp. DA14 TaxID=2956798 RepID=UPI0020B69435|nr:RNA methyltransferase [Gilvimarinus sp. DA14]UTF60973.1 RNA methyltransferase [Gilvimarinus sp. DA14]
MQRRDSEAYLAKKQFYDSLLTVYGRKPVLEALQMADVKIHRLHLADSNKPAAILSEIIAIAEGQGAEILYHSRNALSRISKNSKQDQGIAVDLLCPKFSTLASLLEQQEKIKGDLLALDGITNPQNLGMIIRSACAGNIAGILLPSKGNAQIDPLVIKASAGTLFRAPIIRLEKTLEAALSDLTQAGYQITGLSSHSRDTLSQCSASGNVFVLGNETHGVSAAVDKLCHKRVKIPMNNGVESLNVAVTAALIAFRHSL